MGEYDEAHTCTLYGAQMHLFILQFSVVLIMLFTYILFLESSRRDKRQERPSLASTTPSWSSLLPPLSSSSLPSSVWWQKSVEKRQNRKDLGRRVRRIFSGYHDTGPTADPIFKHRKKYKSNKKYIRGIFCVRELSRCDFGSKSNVHSMTASHCRL